MLDQGRRSRNDRLGNNKIVVVVVVVMILV